MSEFDSIRPYNDDEVLETINRLLQDKEFIDSISKFKLPKLGKIVPGISSGMVRKSLSKQLKGVDSIRKFQDVISIYVQSIIDNSSTGISESGLSSLDKNKSYLFISNHRDIVLDPALVNYLLHKKDHNTAEIAIGDNLLMKPFVSDLMRLNKSFIVDRSSQGREKLLSTKLLSKYINQSIKEGRNIWIAQKEGRAKDGIDFTDPAILKMFHLDKRNQDRNAELKDTINDLNIVPVSISYEFDPCDSDKAIELFEKNVNGSFEKSEKSDLISISKGIQGFKGQMHVSFGNEIKASDSDPDTIAKQIDEQIISNYKLYHTNYLAYELIQQEDPSVGPTLAELNIDIQNIDSYRKEFNERLISVGKEMRSYFLKMYAAPMINHINLLIS